MQSRNLRQDGHAGMRRTLIRKRCGNREPERNAGSTISAMALAGILLVLSCGDGAVEPTPVPPAPVATTVAVSPASATLTAFGETTRFTAEVRDQNGQVMAGATVAWTSSDASVAAVDASGVVTAAANGEATITATAGSVSGTAAVAVAQVVHAVTVSPPADTLVTFGDTLRLVAEANDANGHAVADAEFSWESSADAVATVDGSGLVTAVGVGTTEITARSSGATGTARLRVLPPNTLTITRSEPATMVEGGSATIRGWGFSSISADNVVSIGGLAATVTSATDTALTIQVPRSDCLPPRRSQLRVAVADESDTLTVGVTPRTGDELDLPQHQFRYTRPGNGCLHLPGNASGGEYLIGVTSISEDPSSLTAVTLHGTPGDASVVSAASPVAGIPTSVADLEGTGVLRFGPDSPGSQGPQIHFGGLRDAADTLRRRNARAQNDMMARNLELVQRLGRPTVPGRERPAASAVRSLEAGDVVVLNTGFNRTCTASEEVTALVRLVGEHTIWLEDTDSPSGTFTDAEMEELDAFYASSVKPVHDSYFGELSDVDGNDAFLILMTAQVNRADAFAWVSWGDLYSKERCATSNHAEIFHAPVPDPDGTVGSMLTKQQLLELFPIYLLAHEVTHLIQANAFVFGSVRKTQWEIEGGASLAEQLVAYRMFEHGSGQNLGWSDYRLGEFWYWNAWVADLASFFGWDSDNNGRVRNAPEQCSWVGLPREGNDGPCKRPLDAIYGMPSMVFRLVMDLWGDGYPGGEAALMKRLTQSPAKGFASLEEVSSVRIEEILTHFYVALWADGREYDGGTYDIMRSWNLHDIMSRYPANHQLMPYTAGSAEPGVTARVRAGSSLYLHWNPSGSLSPTSIRVTTPGGRVPENIFVWGLRLR